MVETVSRGKHLLTRIDRGPDRWTLHTHLKMEGTWQVLTPRQRWPRPAHTARVVLETARATAVGFSLGVVELLDRAAEDDVVGHLGPDLLGPDWDEERALANLTRDPDAGLGEALLDQTNLAGIGNDVRRRALLHLGRAPAARRSPPCPTCAGWFARAHQMLELNKERRHPVDHRRPARAASRCGSTRRDGHRAAAAARRSSRRAGSPGTGASDVLVPELPVRPSRPLQPLAILAIRISVWSALRTAGPVSVQRFGSSCPGDRTSVPR